MEKTIGNRLKLLALAVVLMATAIGARLYQLQVVKCEAFRAKALTQHQQKIEVPATRGAILDRNFRELATSVEVVSLYVHADRLENPRHYAELLAPVLGVSRKKLQERMESGKNFVWLSRFLDPDTAAAVRSLNLPMDGTNPFGFEIESKREYPAGRSSVHVVGYANIDSKGVEGIEQQFDFELDGDATVFLVRQDARQGTLHQVVKWPEKQPLDLILTIDSVLQHISQSELDRAVKESGARAGSVILLDPETGEVLSLVNWPAADPARYGKASDAARINRALVHFYEPGSTFKIVPLAAALEHKQVWPGKRFFCENGLLRRGRRQIRDTSPHGHLTVRQILAESSCIGMVKVTENLAPETLSEMISSFGFGHKTGIELPGESPGSFEPPARWSAFSQASLSFGQEVGVTVLQMASAMGVIANDGVLVPPRIVIGTREIDGHLHQFDAPPPRRIISSTTADQIASMLRGVVANGTGSRAELPGYQIAGKTGTAQKAQPGGGYSPTEYMASFAGFGPLSSPRLVGIVVLDSPAGDWHQGGQVAAPVFARILGRALHYMRVPYDRGSPLTVSLTEPLEADTPIRTTSANRKAPPGIVPNLYGLSAREALALLAASGCKPRVNGSGVVISQQPPAGSALPPEGICLIELGAREELVHGRQARQKEQGS